jgi:hypothetical protein
MAAYRSSQPVRIPVEVNHRTGIGQVVYLERGERQLVAVGVVDLEPGDLEAFGPVTFSTTTAHDRIDGGIELRSLAVVRAEDAASVGLGPVRWVPGDLRRGALRQVGLRQRPAILTRAEEWCRTRRWGDPLAVVERRDLSVAQVTPDRGWEPVAFDSDGEPVAVRRYSRPLPDTPGNPVSPIEHSAHRGWIIAVR